MVICVSYDIPEEVKYRKMMAFAMGHNNAQLSTNDYRILSANPSGCFK